MGLIYQYPMLRVLALVIKNLRSDKCSLSIIGLLNRVTRSVEDVESADSLDEELDVNQDWLKPFEERHARSDSNSFLMRPTRSCSRKWEDGLSFCPNLVYQVLLFGIN